MKTSIILFTLAKHLNKAALELETLENESINEAVSNFAEAKTEVLNGTEKTSEEAVKSSSESTSKEEVQVVSSKKATSSKKAPKASK